MYADVMTKSLTAAIHETNRRRAIQEAHNKKHGITPEGISKAMGRGAERSQPKIEKSKLNLKKIPKEEYGHLIKDLTSQMDLASANLEFEKAAELRDLIQEIKDKL
jgi:excinuclease ABC subunit B